MTDATSIYGAATREPDLLALEREVTQAECVQRAATERVLDAQSALTDAEEEEDTAVAALEYARLALRSGITRWNEIQNQTNAQANVVKRGKANGN